MGGCCLTAIGGGASIAGLKGPAHDEVQTAAGCLRWPRRSLFHWHGWPQWREAWVYRGLYGCRIYRIPENLGLATTSCLHNIAATGPTFVMVPQNSGIRGLLPSCDARPPGGVPVPAGGFAGPEQAAPQSLHLSDLPPYNWFSTISDHPQAPAHWRSPPHSCFLFCPIIAAMQHNPSSACFQAGEIPVNPWENKKQQCPVEEWDEEVGLPFRWRQGGGECR